MTKFKQNLIFDRGHSFIDFYWLFTILFLPRFIYVSFDWEGLSNTQESV